MAKGSVEAISVMGPNLEERSADGLGLTVEQLSNAVGQSALLQAEVNREIAIKLLQTRDELRATKNDIEVLRQQLESLIHGVQQVLTINSSGHRPEAKEPEPEARAAPRPGVVMRLINPAKLLKMGSNLRLNVGCGTKPLPEYFNVDERELDGVDLIADVRSLPFAPGSISEIYAAHIVEHFTETDLKSQVLPAWRQLLRPGGTFRVVVPDAEGMILGFSQGTYPFESLRTVTYGGQDYPGNFHYTMFSRDSLLAVLRGAGFVAGEYTATDRVNGLCLEMEIAAVKSL